MKRVFFTSLILLFTIFTNPVFAQETRETENTTVSNIVINNIDTVTFPDVVLSYQLLDENGALVDIDDDPIVIHNDTVVADVEVEFPVVTGVDYTFVVDANISMTAVDEEGGINRAAKTRIALAEFIRESMNEDGLDRVTMITSDAGTPVILADRLDNTQETIDAIGTFNPQQFPDRAPVQEMLALALERASEPTDEKRYQLIVLLTNGGFLLEQLNYDTLINLAAQNQSEFYGILLGQRADENEINNLSPLINAMGGSYMAMGQSTDISPLGTVASSHSRNAELTYVAPTFDPNGYTVVISAGGQTAETTYSVTIEPPAIDLLITSKSIVRKGADDVATADFSPARVPVKSQVTWPDDRPRSLDSVTLLVNGVAQSIPRGALLDNTGMLTVDWDVADLKAGSYQLKMIIVDQFGMVAESQTVLVPIAIQLSRPTATAQPLPTITPIPSVIGQVADVTMPLLTRTNLARFLGILIPALAIILLWRYLDNRQAVRMARLNAEKTAPSPIDETKPLQPSSTTIASTQSHKFNSTADLLVPARLERFIPSTGYIVGVLPLTQLTHVVGSDPLTADLIIDHGSVSRLHASIRYEHGRFLLYDEGSAYGTRLNFEQLGLSPRFLKEDDEISFGDVYVRFKLGSQDDDVPDVISEINQYTNKSALSLDPVELEEKKEVASEIVEPVAETLPSADVVELAEKKEVAPEIVEPVAEMLPSADVVEPEEKKEAVHEIVEPVDEITLSTNAIMPKDIPDMTPEIRERINEIEQAMNDIIMDATSDIDKQNETELE